MRMILATQVRGDYKKVFSGFDESLLLKLVPPGMKLTLKKADPPSQPGGGIHIQVKLLGFIQQHWENDFADYELRDDECHFADVGRSMPFPINSWRHDHRVQRDGDHARILDDITFGTGFFLTDWLLYPIIYLQFAYRRPIYRRHFGKP